MHVIGGSGTGKSKFLEWMIRQDLRDGRGLCLIDWHGTLYNDVLRCCAYHGVGVAGDFRSLVLLNLPGRGGGVSLQVSRRVDATVRSWGASNTDLMPTFSRICRLLYSHSAPESLRCTPESAV